MNIFGGKSPQELARLVYSKDPSLDPDLTFKSIMQTPAAQGVPAYLNPGTEAYNPQPPAMLSPNAPAFGSGPLPGLDAALGVGSPLPQGMDFSKMLSGMYGAMGTMKPYDYSTVPISSGAKVGATEKKPLAVRGGGRAEILPLGDLIAGRK